MDHLKQAKYNIKLLNERSVLGNYFIREEKLSDGTPRYAVYRKVDYNPIGRPVTIYGDAKEIEDITYNLSAYALEEKIAEQEKAEEKRMREKIKV